MSSPIAVLGMSGRFPGAGTLDEFWHNLVTGTESIRRLDPDEQRSWGVAEQRLADPQFVAAAPVLDGVEEFDAAFFGMTRREAELRDPQQRLFLETAHATLEHAGYDPARFPGAIGVFAGVGVNHYASRSLYADPERLERLGRLAVGVANDHDFIATLAAYHLDLRGPALTVATACSTSLVAVHLACEALRRGDCDLALAGACALDLENRGGYLHQEGGVLSPDGHCRPFDADAHGTVWGSGVGAVLLKPLAAALADRDTVHAVVLGSAVNNDGARKRGFTAPSVEGQTAVVEAALAAAGVDPRSIGYVEAHGTGTLVGDPVEVEALSRAYGRGTPARQWARIGSVKSNVGHTLAAAGMASLLKAARTVQEGTIPPTLHVARPNPRIDFASSPFAVADTATPWTGDGAPRRAGVSAFGIGGTNAHVILEQAPEQRGTPSRAPRHLLPLSAHTAPALSRAIADLGAHLAERPGIDLGDVAATLQVGRGQHRHRAVVVASDSADAAEALRGADPRRVRTGEAGGTAPPVAFLLSGQGAQHPGMGRGLYEAHPVFRDAVDSCARLLEPHVGADLRATLYPDREDDEAAERLAQTALTQPALFTVEYALAQLWRSWGVEPARLLGHSIGEYVAACLAGVFSLSDALGLVAARGRLIQQLPPGAMLAVRLDELEVAPLLAPELSVATVNGPGMCVVAGPVADVEGFAAGLREQGVAASRLRTSHAFHSPMMEPALAAFAALVAAVPRAAPRIPLLSNVTGDWLTAEQAVDPGYWARHLRATVRFGDGVARLLAAGSALVEVGPGRTLADLARLQVPLGQPAPLASLPAPRAAGVEADSAAVLSALGDLWLRGVEVDWDRVEEPGRRRVPLPTYPFERQRHWIDPPVAASQPEPVTPIGARPLEDWFEVPGWRQAPPLVAPADPAAGPWLVLCDPAGPGAELAARLRDRGAEVVAGDEGLAQLGALRAAGRAPARIVAAWGLRPPAPGPVAEEAGELFARLLALGQALAERAGEPPPALDVVTCGAQDVTGADLVAPARAVVAGVCRVLPLELPGAVCRHLDTDTTANLDRLVDELCTPSADPVVALRCGRRWLPSAEPVRVRADAGRHAGWRERGVYLLTGGLGGIGLSVAEDLARRVRARLVLVGRGAPGARARAAIRRMEAAGAEVLVCAADVTDADALRGVRRQVLDRFGTLHGIVHAAGVPGDGMIAVREPAAAAAVLAPKVAGTLALTEVFADLELDALVLCSSVTALIGGLGQADYCAANAFLDAYARSPREDGLRVVSVDWGGWLDVGMTAADRADGGLHPWLDERRDEADGGVVVAGTLGPATHWVLDEHRVAGVPVLPGTAHLELLRAAFAAAVPAPDGHVVELRDVDFLVPLAVPHGTAARVEVVVGPGAGTRPLMVRTEGAVHARATAGWVPAGSGDPLDLAAVRARCTEAVDGGLGGDVVDYGPRWDCAGARYLGREEQLTELVAPPAVAAELAGFGAHPALLDVATAGPPFDGAPVLPLGYGRVRFARVLPARAWSHVRTREAGARLRSADVTVTDEDGREVLVAEDFVLRAVDPEGLAESMVVPPAPAPGGSDAISAADGPEALRRLLAAGLGPQVVVSAVALEALREDVQASARGLVEPAPSPVELAGPPLDGLEGQVAALWAEVLGVPDVGADDDFLELGGNSLVAVQLVWRVGADLDTKLSMRSLFEAPTVAGMVAEIERVRAVGARDTDDDLELVPRRGA